MDLSALQEMPTRELWEWYAEVFGEASRSSNQQWLLRRVAWRVQLLTESDLSDRTMERVRARRRSSPVTRTCGAVVVAMYRWPSCSE